MNDRRRRRARWAALATVVVAIGAAGAAFAAYPQSNVASYTGCLNTTGTGNGTINSVAVSATTPLKPCGQNQVVVHFSGGTITQITAGTGLTGGGNNGYTTLNLSSTYQLPQGCSNNQIIHWSSTGSVWTCANDQTYTNGTGLDLTGNTFSINSGYQLPQTGCGSGQVVSSNGSGGWTCVNQNSYSGANFALSNQACNSGQFLTGFDSSGLKQCANDQTYSGANFAVSNQSCPAGQYVGGVDASGNVTCNTDNPTGLNSEYTNTAFIAVTTAPSTPATEADCNTGDVAVSGGVDMVSLEGSIKLSKPVGNPPTGWDAEENVTALDAGANHNFVVYVVCAKTS